MKNSFLYGLVSLATSLTAQINPACTNTGFESVTAGSYSALPGWTLSGLSSSPSYTLNGTCTNLALNNTSSLVVISTPAGNIPLSPFTGNQIAYLITSGSENVKRMEHTFSVTAQNSFFQYAYFLSMDVNAHPVCCNNHYFLVRFFDCNNNIIPNSSLEIAPPSPTCSTSNTLGMIPNPLSPGLLICPGWIIRNVSLSAYIGSCVTIRVECGACTFGGHYPSISFDANCSAGPFAVNGNYTGSSYVMCNTPTATLSAVAANSYTWSGPAGTSTAQNIVTSTPGIYTLTTNNLNSLITSTFSLSFASTPTLQVSASTTTVCTGQSAILTATGTGISTYSWSNGGTASAITVTPSANTVYTVTANASTCPASATVGLNVSACVGISEYFSVKRFLNVYPNPTKGDFNVSSATPCSIQVTDLTGRILHVKKLDEYNGYRCEISGLPAGVYFVCSSQITQKVVITD